MKRILATLFILLTFCVAVHSQVTNAAGVGLNFTNSTLPGWTLSAGGTQSPTGYSSQGVGASIVTGMSNFQDGQYTWNITPYTGQYMVSLQPGGSSASYSAMTSALDLSSTSITSIQKFLNTNSGGGATNPTNAAWMDYTGLQLTAGTTFTLAWNFVATDYTPWNDTSITTLVATSGGGLATINNVVGQYSVLGAINPGSGNYSTNSYGSTGWELANYTINTTGTYELGFGSFNLGDTVNSPILLVSGSQGTTRNGTTPVGPVAPNPGSSAPATPPPKTVTGTSTSNTTSTIIIGSQVVTVTTPTTVTTYSDGSTSTSTGTPTQTTLSNNAITGAKFGAAQVADTQWNVYACTQTNSCQIYSTNPGGTYETGSWTPISSTQYITLIPNTGSDSSTYPWEMILVNSDGTFSVLGVGKILVEGTDSSGNIYIFFSNANENGTLLSGNLGLSGQGVTFSGTANPTPAQTNTLAGNMSTSVLSAGQTGGTPISAPTVTGTSTTYTYSTTTSGNTTYTYETPVTTTTWSDGSTTTSTGSQSLYSTAVTTDQTTTTYTYGATTTVTTTYTLPNVNVSGSNLDNTTYTSTGTISPVTTTNTTTPVTTTTYSNGSTSTTDGNSSSTSSTVNNYSVTNSSITPAMSNPYAGTTTNAVYIDQVSGSYSNTLIANQYGQGNLIAIYMSGEGNTVNANQGYALNSLGNASQSTASNSNTQGISVTGNNNSYVGQQVGNNNSAIMTITGNTNSTSITQNGNSNQSYNLINGSGNSLTVSQNGNSNSSSINLYGAGNVAAVTQSGTGNMSSMLNLTNAGGANNVLVTQTGAVNQSYVLQQSCANPAGCNVTVHQGN